MKPMKIVFILCLIFLPCADFVAVRFIAPTGSLQQACAEEISSKVSAYNFVSDGDWYQEYCWLSGSQDQYGRWTFINLNKEEVKSKIKIALTLLAIKVDKNGKETKSSSEILINVGRLKTKKYVGGEATGQQEDWDYSVIKDLSKNVESGVLFTIEVDKSLLPEDGNLAVKIIRRGNDNRPWLGIKKDSVTISY